MDAFWWVGLYHTLTLTGSEGIELSHQVCGSLNITRVLDLRKNILTRRHTYSSRFCKLHLIRKNSLIYIFLKVILFNAKCFF